MRTALATICFDDGRETALTLGASILEKYGARGTFYPITENIGGKNEHGAFAPWETIVEVHGRGHEVGSHSHTHRRALKDWERTAQQDDLRRSIELLKERGIKPTTFAYPFGYVSPSLIESARKAGFVAARTVKHGMNSADTDPMLLRSFALEDKHTLEDVARELEKVVPRLGWLILTFHHLDDKTYISTPPDMFERMVEHIIACGVPIVTLAEGAQLYRA